MFARLDAITPESSGLESDGFGPSSELQALESVELESDQPSSIPTQSWLSELEAITPTYLDGDEPAPSQSESVSFSLSIPEPLPQKKQKKRRKRDVVPSLGDASKLEGEDFNLDVEREESASKLTVFMIPVLMRPGIKKEVKASEIGKADFQILSSIDGEMNIGELARKTGKNLLSVRASLQNLVDRGFVLLSEPKSAERRTVRKAAELRGSAGMGLTTVKSSRIRIDLVLGLAALLLLLYAIPKFTDYLAAPPAPDRPAFEKREPRQRPKRIVPPSNDLEADDEAWKKEAFSVGKKIQKDQLPPATIEKIKKDSSKWGGAL